MPHGIQENPLVQLAVTLDGKTSSVFFKVDDFPEILNHVKRPLLYHDHDTKLMSFYKYGCYKEGIHQIVGNGEQLF